VFSKWNTLLVVVLGYRRGNIARKIKKQNFYCNTRLPVITVARYQKEIQAGLFGRATGCVYIPSQPNHALITFVLYKYSIPCCHTLWRSSC
jgi:hypothetical protein